MVSTAELATMGAALAQRGVHPATGNTVVQPLHARDMLTLMYAAHHDQLPGHRPAAA